MSPTTDLDEFMKGESKGFQMLTTTTSSSNFEFPVYAEFGYTTYDDETNRFYVAGGYKDWSHHSKFYEIEMVLQDESSSFYPRIVDTLDLPHGKGICGCVCTKLHHKVYVIGGHDKDNYLKDVYSFDTATRRWEKEASMNTARHLPSVTLTRGGTSIMVCGGTDKFENYLDTCEEYNDRSKEWTVLPYRLIYPRYGHVSICYGSRVVVAGGYNSDSLVLAETEVIDLDSFNPQWNFGPPLEEKRHGCAACIVGDYIVVAGGYHEYHNHSSCEATVTRDIARGKWRLLRGLDMNQIRYSFGMVLVGSHLMALSGGDIGETTCETLDVSSLLTLQRATTRATEPPLGFFGELAKNGGWSTMEHKLEQLATTSCNVLETKVLYTYTKQCIRLGLIDRLAAGRVIKAGLQTAAKMCPSEHTYVMYMMILEKARADLFVTQQDIHQLQKSQAGQQRAQDVPLAKNVVDETSPTESHCVGDYVKGLSTHALKLLDYAEQVRTNCKMQLLLFKHAPMDVLQANGSFLQKVKNGLSERQRIDAVDSFIMSVASIVTGNIGDNSSGKGLEKVLLGVVDFSDPDHIREVIESRLAESDSDHELCVAIKNDFEHGVRVAKGDSEDLLVGAIEGGNAIVCLAVIAVLGSELVGHDKSNKDEIEVDARARQVEATTKT